MTFPNRRNYTPGEKKRARKYDAVDQKPPATAAAGAVHAGDAAPASLQVLSSPPSAASRTRGASGKQRAKRAHGGERVLVLESPLQVEMIAELAVFSPVHDPSSPSFAFKGVGFKASHHHHPQQQQHAAHASLAPLLVSKQQLKQKAEDAMQRLLDDELFQQQNARDNRLLAFSNVIVASKSGDDNNNGEGFDPFQAAVQQLPPLVMEASSGNNSDNLQSVLADLQGIGVASMQELEQPLAMINDTPIRESYRDVVSTLQEWNLRQLQIQQHQELQQQQQLFRSSSPGFASPRTLPASPSDVLLTGMGGRQQQQQVKKRTNLSKTAKTVLKTWFDNHLHHPYPTEEEKDMLGLKGGITIEQVNNWFINTRGRKWKPMLTRLMAEKEAGECKLYDQMVERIEEPYRRAPTKR